jgi:predicted Zn-dependent protease
MLRDVAQRALAMTSADTASIRIEHSAIGAARVEQSRLRLNDSGDRLHVELVTQFGRRRGVELIVNQLDDVSLRDAMAYLEHVAHEQSGDPTSLAVPIPPRTYLPNTTWNTSAVAAYDQARHSVMPALVDPLLHVGFTAAAFAGVYVRSTIYADKTGIVASGQETDTELTVTGWSPDGRGSGWAGQAARDWAALTPDRIAADALRLTTLSANPVALEPGRRLAILDRPAMAQLVRSMGSEFSIRRATTVNGVLFDRVRQAPKLGEKIMDERVTISSDPNDPDGGYLPFNSQGFPLIPMTWIERGVVTHLAWDAEIAAQSGVTPANDPPQSLRVSGGLTSVEEMIANCKEGVYVRRFAQIMDVDSASGTVTGVTTGGCFLVKHGKIEKSIKNFRFMASPWHIFSKFEAIGPTERTAFGYAPWAGKWPIPPVIVPPVMVRDFNFVALADAI